MKDEQVVNERISELSRLLATHFEPRNFDLMEHPSRVSPEGFWLYVGGQGWQPRLITEAEVFVRIVKHPMFRRLEQRMPTANRKCWQASAFHIADAELEYATEDTPELAAAEALVKVLGLK